MHFWVDIPKLEVHQTLLEEELREVKRIQDILKQLSMCPESDSNDIQLIAHQRRSIYHVEEAISARAKFLSDTLEKTARTKSYSEEKLADALSMTHL